MLTDQYTTEEGRTTTRWTEAYTFGLITNVLSYAIYYIGTYLPYVGIVR